jgi:hypothetical protein
MYSWTPAASPQQPQQPPDWPGLLPLKFRTTPFFSECCSKLLNLRLNSSSRLSVVIMSHAIYYQPLVGLYWCIWANYTTTGDCQSIFEMELLLDILHKNLKYSLNISMRWFYMPIGLPG